MKNLLCCLFFTVLGWGTLSSFSQEVWSLPPDERIGVSDSNRLYFPSDSLWFYDMFQRWDSLLLGGEGHLNVLHIGGSHVQAGMFSHQMRRHLLEIQPGLTSSRGFLFPFTAAKTNNPYNYQVKCSGNWSSCKNTGHSVPYIMGLSGMVVVPQTRTARLSLRLRNNDGLKFRFDKVRLFAYSDSGNVVPILQTGGLAYQGTYDTSSRTYLYVLDNPTDSFRLIFRQRDSVWEDFYIRGFQLENDEPGITYHAIGVNGASVPSYLQCPLFENDLQFVRPDLCVLGIGINDASGDHFDTTLFRKRYEMLLDEILRVSPDCRFLFITNNDSYRSSGRRRYSVNSNGLLARDVFYRLASEYKGAVWDLFSVMGGLKSMSVWEAKGLAQKDKVHFTSKGYRYVADLLYNALMQSYAYHLKGEVNYGVE